MSRLYITIVTVVLLLIIHLFANADNIMIGGALRISSGGSLVFPDGSAQYTATLQGPKGDKGDTGATGPQGPPGPTVTSFGQLNYYALGDSITYGVGSISGSYSYADVLNANLKLNSFTKLAVGGTTTTTTQGRFELATQINNTGSNADIISILIGSNDYIVNNTLGDVDIVLSKPYISLDRSLSFS